MNTKTISPIIIIGMHRSGTSMVSRLLEELGLFLGHKKQKDHEAIFFVGINDWLLNQSGGSWDHPQAFRYLLENEHIRSLAETYTKYIISTPQVAGYLGLSRYLKYRSLQKLDIPWGWKDPRSTFTLPFWLDLFPDAKVIHIYRNGIDVANSLKVREDKAFSRTSQPINDQYKKKLYMIRPKKGGFIHSVRCTSLDGGFSLWEEYLREARKHVNSLGERALEFRYEDFLDEPHSVLSSLVKFCDLSVNNSDVSKAVGRVKKSRAYAYKSNPELMAFSEDVISRLQLYGY